MTLKTALYAAGALLCAAPAFAQTTPARPAAQPAAQPAAPASPGPVIPGVCLLDTESAIAGSAAGRAASARMNALTQQVEAELTPERNAINAELTRIRALPAAQQQTPGAALQTRANTFQALAARREQELQRTQVTALRRIEGELSTVISQLYVQRGCGLMISRNAVIYGNPAMDVTALAVTQLNTRLPTITFNREQLPAGTTPATPR